MEAARINFTNPDPYDQVFVLSQKIINDGFKNMFLTLKGRTPLPVQQNKPRLLNFAYTDNTTTPASWMKAQFDRPEIELEVTGSRSPANVYLIMAVRNGSIKLAARPRSFSIAGWTFVFEMTIHSKVLEKNDAKFKVYEGLTGFKSGVFELSQLYLDVSDPSSHPNSFQESKSQIDKASIAGYETEFRTFIGGWLAYFMQHEVNILGYSLTSQSPASANQALPSLTAPKSIDYCTYPWRDPDPTLRGPDRDKDEKNALCYLVMGDLNQRVSGGIPYSGPFVKDDALFCMNEQLFWKKWLLPLLAGLYHETQMIPHGRTEKDWPNDEPLFDYGSSDTSQLSWAEQVNSDGSRSWNFNGAPKKTSVSKNWHPTVDGRNAGTGKTSIDQTAKSSIHASFKAGGTEISVTGSHEFEYHYNQTSHLKDPKVQEQRYHYYVDETGTISWHLNFRLLSIGGTGELQIERIPDPNPNDCCKTTVQNKNNWGKPIIRTIFQDLGRKLGQHFHDNLDAHMIILNQNLQHQRNLMVPGAGVYAMRNPRFNKRGDVLASLEYISVEPPVTGPVTSSKVVNPLNKVEWVGDDLHFTNHTEAPWLADGEDDEDEEAPAPDALDRM